jgi:hypothetical protein
MRKTAKISLIIRVTLLVTLIVGFVVMKSNPPMDVVHDLRAWASGNGAPVSAERQRTAAIHEAGHVVTSWALRGPRSVQSVRVYDKTNDETMMFGEAVTNVEIWQGSHQEAMRVAAMMYAGLVSEELIGKHDSDGSENDEGAATRVLVAEMKGGAEAEHGMSALHTVGEVNAFMRNARDAVECAQTLTVANEAAVSALADAILAAPERFGRRRLNNDDLRAFFATHKLVTPKPECEF